MFAIAFAPFRRGINLCLFREICSREGFRIFLNILNTALSNHSPTMYACPWSNINQIISRPNRFFVMLNYDESITEIPQFG